MIPGSDVPPGMTAVNWRTHPHAPWAFRNVAAFLPHAVVRAGGAARPLPAGRPLAVPAGMDEFLAATHADGFFVVDQGRVVFSRYIEGMGEGQRHLAFSVTKALVGIVAERLIDVGGIAADARAGDVADLAGTAFADATLRDLLDMIDGVPFDETYADASADIHAYSRHFWGTGEGGVLTALRRLPPRVARRGFAYRTPVFDVIGIMLAAATGEPIEALMSALVWQPCGAADDAHWVLDTGGRAIASAGFACTLPDLARVGLWLAERRDAAIARIAAGGDRAAFAAADQPTRPGFSYRSGWWIDHPTGAWNALGVFGQRLHVAPDRGLVIARFGSHPVASNAATDAEHAAMFDAIAVALSYR
ncbi:MAG: serine hydrolase [Sphingomonadaceae bacterium]|nr:serine hydrolase [Sphingomonadaceae bacterium]